MEQTIQPERRRYVVRRFAFLKNFSVKARLFGAGALALAGLLVTGGAGYVGLTQSNAGLDASITATSAVLNQKHADMMHDALRGDVLYALRAGPAAPAALRAEIEADLQTHVGEFTESMDNLRALDLSAKTEADVLAAMPPLEAYVDSARTIADLAFRDAAGAQALWPEFMVAFSTLEDSMGILGEEIEAEGNAAALAAHDRNRRRLNIIVIAISACVAVILVSNFLLARSITIPIRRVKEAIGMVIAGKYDGRHSSFDRASDKNDEITQISGHLEVLRERLRKALEMEETIRVSQDRQVAVVNALSVGLEDLSRGRLTDSIAEVFPAEYESLRANFNVTIDRLNDSLTEIAKASRTIRGQADGIATASEDLAHRTENQAATLEQTAAALDALTSSVKAAATGAREVEGIVQNTKVEAEESNKVVVQAVEAMNGIERSSEQISRIIGVIEDIAFQTNLLALNAGVEAARAGESGRGFAVVASEVRALAQRSADASHEIKELITSSTQFVDRGVRSVGLAGKALSTIVDRVGHISGLVTEIAAGAVQQSTALGEVNIGVTQLDQVAQRNAAMVEQSMTATQALRQEALGLDAIMSRFTTKGTGDQHSQAPLRRAG